MVFSGKFKKCLPLTPFNGAGMQSVRWNGIWKLRAARGTETTNLRNWYEAQMFHSFKFNILYEIIYDIIDLILIDLILIDLI